jgi:hypothetical protein
MMHYIKNCNSVLPTAELKKQYIESNRMRVFKTGLALTIIRIILIAYLWYVSIKYKLPAWKDPFGVAQFGVIVVQAIIVVLILIIKKPWYTEWSITIWLVLQYSSINVIGKLPLLTYLFQ